MLHTSRILVRAPNHGACAGIVLAALLSLTGCGQTGTLYLPTEPAAARRATLPESLWPVMPRKTEAITPDASTPAAPAAPTPENTKP